MTSEAQLPPYQDVFARANKECLSAVLCCGDRSQEDVAAYFELLDGMAGLSRGLVHWVQQFAQEVWEAWKPPCSEAEGCYIWFALISALGAGLTAAEADFLCITPDASPKKNLVKLMKLNTAVLAEKVKKRAKDPFLKAFGKCLEQPSHSYAG